jgi:hypothetical protein
MSNWFSSGSAQVQAPTGSTSTSPALAAFNGKLYVAWKGKDTDQRLLVSSSADGVNWSAQVQAPSGSTSTSPALAAFDGKLYVADAVTKLQGDGLQVEETNVTAIFNTADYKVTSQSPAGEHRSALARWSKLTIEAITQPPIGYSSVTVNNVNTDDRSVDLYIVDLTSNPNVSASEGILDWNHSKVINLTTNDHNYQVIAVDTELTGCPSSDPFTLDCQRAITPSPGVLCSSTGGTYPLDVN